MGKEKKQQAREKGGRRSAFIFEHFNKLAIGALRIARGFFILVIESRRHEEDGWKA